MKHPFACARRAAAVGLASLIVWRSGTMKSGEREGNLLLPNGVLSLMGWRGSRWEARPEAPEDVPRRRRRRGILALFHQGSRESGSVSSATGAPQYSAGCSERVGLVHPLRNAAFAWLEHEGFARGGSVGNQLTEATPPSSTIGPFLQVVVPALPSISCLLRSPSDTFVPWNTQGVKVAMGEVHAYCRAYQAPRESLLLLVLPSTLGRCCLPEAFRERLRRAVCRIVSRPD